VAGLAIPKKERRYRIGQLRMTYAGDRFAAMDWLTAAALVVGLVLAFATGRTLRKTRREGDRLT